MGIHSTADRKGGGISATVWNGKIYVAGGSNGSGDLNSTSSLTIQPDVWTILPELNKSRLWPSLFVVGGRLYIVGGTQNSEKQTFFFD